MDFGKGCIAERRPTRSRIVGLLVLTIVGLCFLYPKVPLAQDFMIQGWYWDYPGTPDGKNWADTLQDKATELANAGFTYVWLPPLSRASSGNTSNGYDPQDLYDLGEAYGGGPTRLGTRTDVDDLIAAFNGAGINAVSDMVYNHRDGGSPEDNPSVEGWIENLDWGKANAGDNPYPSDRFRCYIPLGSPHNFGEGTYYFKIRSRSWHDRFDYMDYKVYMETNTVGWQGLPDQNESEPNGGGDCGQANNAISLGVNMLAQTDDVGGCIIDEFALTISSSDFSGDDTLWIYLDNQGGNYSDHYIHGLWYDDLDNNPPDQDIQWAVGYQTWTDFTNMPSGQGAMDQWNFKPNGNPTQLAGDWDWPWFFYDYDQTVASTQTVLQDWTRWMWNTVGVRGYRLDAVKHFDYAFTGDLLDHLHDNAIDPGMVVGEFFDGNAGTLKGWIDNVLANMDGDTKASINPRAFDFSLRYALEGACDQFGYDARDVFTASMVDAAGASGFNVVTFTDNHDFRDPGTPIDNDPILAYAYILTNNQIGLPCVFYYDYYNRGLKSEIDKLIKVHQDHIYGASNRDYLSRNGTPYTQIFTTGYATTTLFYQLSGMPSGRDVLVAINFAGEALNVTHGVNVTSMNLSVGDTLTDVIGNASSQFMIVDGSGNVQFEIPARSYTIWVQGDITPPFSSCSSPDYDNGGTIPVTWTASDTGAGSSGVAYTKLYYKFGLAGAWTYSSGDSAGGTSGTFNFNPPSGDGMYYFQTIATDSADNTEPGPSDPGDDTTFYDTQPPGVPSLISPADGAKTADTTPTFTWSASSDPSPGSGLKNYRILIDDEPGFSTPYVKDYYTPNTFYTPSLSEGHFYWKVLARDSADNNSVWSSTWELDIDTTPPFSSCSSLDYDNGGIIPVAWTANDTGSSGVAYTKLYYKFGLAGAWTYSTGDSAGGTSGTFNFNPPSGDGMYYFQTIATDSAGNTEPGPSDAGDDSTLYDTAPPGITYNYPSAGGATNWYNSDPGDVINIDFIWGGGSPLNYARYYIPSQGAWYNIFTADQSSDYTTDWGVVWADVAEGGEGITIAVADVASNAAQHSYIVGVSGFRFQKDTTPPNDPTNVTSPSHTLSTWSNDNTIDVTWTDATDASSGLDGYSILWDTNPTTVPDATKDIEEGVQSTTSPALADGNSHYFHIRSVDNAGNWQSTVHLGPFYIDTTDPSITYTYPSAGDSTVWYGTDPGNVIDIDFGWVANSPLDSAEWRIGAGAWNTIFNIDQSSDYTTDWGVTWADLAEGNNQISVRVADRAGNLVTHTFVVGTSGFVFRKDTTPPGIAYNYPTAGGPTNWYNSDPGDVIDIDFIWVGNSPLDNAQRKIGAGSWVNIFTADRSSDYTDEWDITWASLSEGENEISLRVRDKAGNMTTHLYVVATSGFLFRKDTVLPNDPTGVASTSHAIGVKCYDNTVDIVWTDATDPAPGSGLDGYSILWDTSPATIPDQTKDIEEGVEATTSPVLADGNNHYFHIRSVDNAGNWQSTVHLGPFWIDTTPPPEVWVDDDYCLSCGNEGHSWRYDAFDTIQEPIGVAEAGGTIHVLAGTYAESDTVDRPLIMSGVGVGVSIVQPPSPGFVVTADNVTIETLTIDGSGSDEGIKATSGADSLTVQNCDIYDFVTGVLLDGGAYHVIGSNTIHDNTTGISLQNCTEALVENNVVQDNDHGIIGAGGLGNLIMGNDITGNLGASASGIHLSATAGVEVHFNNITGNTNANSYGVYKAGPPDGDATNNWWGHDTGPSVMGPGLGDAVSANVDYDPWLGVPVDSTQTKHMTGDPDTLDATAQANTVVIKRGTGAAWVTAVQYHDNPGAGHAFTAFIGSYVDVHINDTTDVDEIEIRLYYPLGTPDEQSLRLHWWDGAAWVLCSDQGVNTADVGGYGGYIWAKIRDNTVPTLADLMGAPFGGGGEVQIYVDDDWAGSSFGDQVGTNPDRWFGINAFATIQDGINNCASQGTVWVAAGTYTEHDTVDHPLLLVGAGVGNTIVNTALPGAWVTSDSVTIDGFTYNGTGSDTAIFIDNVSFCTVQNSEVNNCNIGILIQGTGGSHTRRNKVLNTVSQNHNLLGSGWGQYGGSGVQVTYSDSCEIIGCIIRNLEGSGVDAWGADTLLFDNNAVYDIGNGSWPDGSGTGNGIFSSSAAVRITNSTFYDISQSALLLWGSAGGYPGADAGTIDGNRIYDVMQRPSTGTDYGAISLVAGIDNVSLDADTLWGYAQTGSAYPYGIGIDGQGGADPASNISITNCRIFGDPLNDPVAAGGIYLQETVTNITVQNNWIVGNTAFGLRTRADGNTYTGTATNNWWGSCSGPLVQTANVNGLNVTGLGDEIIFGQASDNIPYSPWIGFGGITDVYVDLSYSSPENAAPHTWGQDAFNTVQAGVAAVCDGGTVHIANGTYTEYVTLPDINLTILGESEAGVIIDGVDRSDNCFDDEYPGPTYSTAGGTVRFRTMTIRNGDYGIRIRGNMVLDVRHCTFYQNGWDGTNYDPNPGWACADYATFYGLHGTDGGAIRGGNDGNKIVNCTIYSNDRGVRFSSASTCSVASNLIYDNIQSGIYFSGPNSDNNVFTSNTIYDNKNCGILLGNGLSTGNEVSDNTVYDCWGIGLYMHDQSNLTITGNEGYNDCRNDCSGEGFVMENYGELHLSAGDADVTVENNSFHDSHSYGGGGISLAAGAGTLTNITIRYNTITNNTGGTGLKNGINVDAAVTLTNVIVNYNDIYDNDFGITNPTAVMLDGRYNWWGHYTGPAQASNTPVLGGAPWVGAGNGVSDSVDYSPWLGNSALIPHNWTYYVNTSNFSTIQEAVDDAWGGDLVMVVSGLYNDPNEGVDIDSTLTVRSTHGAEFTIVDPPAGTFYPAAPTSNEDIAFFIWNDNDPISVTIDGFTVTGNSIGIMILDSQLNDSYTFVNNIFEANNVLGVGSGLTGMAIVVERSSGYIDNNIIRNNDGAGIRLSNASNNLVTNNEIYDNGNYGIFVVKSDLAVNTITATPGVTCANNTISGNDIYNNVSIDPLTYQAHGIIFSLDPGSGVALPYGENNLVMDNCFYENDHTGIYVHGQNTLATGRMEILRNCCYQNGLQPGYTDDGIYFIDENYHIFASLNTVDTHGDDGIMLSGTWADIHVNNNNIFDNTHRGFANNTLQTVDAESNWWGHCNGPAHHTNPGGTGDSVTSSVDFEPWLCPSIQTFAISASPPVRSVAPPGAKPVVPMIELSNTTTYTVTVSSIGGFNLPVYLSVCQACCGIEATFDPNPVTPGACGSATSTMTVTVSSGTPYGDYPLSIVGETPYDVYHSAEVILHVGVAPDFVVSASPGEQTVRQRQSASYMVMVTSVNGFSEFVDLSLDGLPGGTTAEITPGSIIPAPYGVVTAALDVQTSLTTPIGSYPLTITGEESEGNTSSAEVLLNVEQAEGDPVVLASIKPATSIAKPGSSFTVCINLDDVSDLYIYSIYAVLSFDTTVIWFDSSFSWEGTCLDSAGTDLKWHYLSGSPDSLEIIITSGGDPMGLLCQGCVLYLDFWVDPNAAPGDTSLVHFEEFILNEDTPAAETEHGMVIVNRPPQFINPPPDTLRFQELVHECFYVYAYDPDGDSLAFWADIPACAVSEGANFDSLTQEFCWLPPKTTPRTCDTVDVDFYVKSSMPDSLTDTLTVTIIVQATQVEAYFPDTTWHACGWIEVPVLLDPNYEACLESLNIQAIYMELCYDPALLTVGEVGNEGLITENWGALTYSLDDEEGIIRASMAGNDTLRWCDTTLAGLQQVPILYVGFWVSEEADTGDCAILCINHMKLNEGWPTVAWEDAVLKVVTYSLYGSVAYCSTNVLVPDVEIALTSDGEVVQTALTDEIGFYEIHGLEGCTDYCITPYREGLPEQVVTSFDASLILRSLVGAYSLTACDSMAADVTGDGSVSAFDASVLLKYVVTGNVGNELIPSHVIGTWLFSPASLCYGEEEIVTNPFNQDFAAIIIGDVSANWPGPLVPKVAAGGIDVSVQGDEAKFRLAESVGAVDMVLTRLGGLQPVEVDIDGALVEWQGDGEGLRIAAASDGEFSEVTVRFARLVPAKFDILAIVDEGTILTATAKVNPVPTEFTLAQNYPNPFNPTTTIEYALPENAKVSVTVYNILGQVVAELVKSEMEAGCHVVRWNAENVASGVYFYQIVANNFTDTKRMVLMK